MAQFDVFRNPRGEPFPLLVDLQADLLSQLATRVVAPMSALACYGASPITRLNPIVTLDEVDYVIVFQELAGIPSAALGERVGTLVSRRNDLVAAIDLLFTGI